MTYSWGIFYPFCFITRSIVTLLLSYFSTLAAFNSCMLNYLRLQFSTCGYIILFIWKWLWMQLTQAQCPFTHWTQGILVYTNIWSSYACSYLAKYRIFCNFWGVLVFAKGTIVMDIASPISVHLDVYWFPTASIQILNISTTSRQPLESLMSKLNCWFTP